MFLESPSARSHDAKDWEALGKGIVQGEGEVFQVKKPRTIPVNKQELQTQAGYSSLNGKVSKKITSIFLPKAPI